MFTLDDVYDAIADEFSDNLCKIEPGNGHRDRLEIKVMRGVDCVAEVSAYSDRHGHCIGYTVTGDDPRLRRDISLAIENYRADVECSSSMDRATFEQELQRIDNAVEVIEDVLAACGRDMPVKHRLNLCASLGAIVNAVARIEDGVAYALEDALAEPAASTATFAEPMYADDGDE